MKRVLKYTLHEHGLAIQPLPRGAQLLHVDDQSGALQLWALVDDTQPLEARTFLTLHTGNDEVPDDAVHIGTALSQGGSVVRHVFELMRG